MTLPSSLQGQPHPLPTDLRQDLPDYWTPWKVSDQIFGQMRSQKGKYKKIEILPTNPEWRFVWRYFYHDKPYKYGIKHIYCVHERHQQHTFELNLSSIEREVEKFPPTWNNEPRSKQRAQAIQRWKEATDPFSPFNTVESDGRKRNWKETKILPLWHGTSGAVGDSITESGFVYFGKTNLGGSSSKDPTSTDEGFFGSGIYFTNSARYAGDIYAKGHLLLAWVSMREPFPVVGDPQQQDMKTLQGKGAYKHYNAHYVPVTSINPSDHYEAIYHPAQEGITPHCDEIVIFHKSQALPRFWIELQVEAPYKMNPSDIPQFVNEMIPHLFKILENPQVDRDQKLRNYLGQELGILLKLKGDDYLEDHGDNYETLYKNLTQLIEANGKVNRNISRLIVGLPPSSSSPSLTAQVQQLQIQPTPQNVTPLSSQPTTPPPAAVTPTAPSPKTPSSPSPKIQQQAQVQTTAQNPTPASWLPNIFQPTTQTPQVYSSPPVKPISKEVPLPSMAFGKAKWEKYFGDIGVEPPLPPNIEEILNSPCIFWSGKKVRDTHLLVLVPEKVNGRPFHLDSLAELIKSPKSGHKTKYDYYNSDVKKELGTKSLGSHWALMTKDVIPNSTNKTYDDQKALVQKHAQSSKIPYELPKALEAATAILMHHVETGERLYENVWSRCQEKVDNNQWPAAIGGFSAGGLVVYFYWYGIYLGVGCCRRV